MTRIALIAQSEVACSELARPKASTMCSPFTFDILESPAASAAYLVLTPSFPPTASPTAPVNQPVAAGFRGFSIVNKLRRDTGHLFPIHDRVVLERIRCGGERFYQGVCSRNGAAITYADGVAEGAMIGVELDLKGATRVERRGIAGLDHHQVLLRLAPHPDRDAQCYNEAEGRYQRQREDFRLERQGSKHGQIHGGDSSWVVAARTSACPPRKAGPVMVSAASAALLNALLQ